MKLRTLLPSLILALTLSAPAAVAETATSGWEPVANAAGILYREFELPGPNHAYVARMDRGAQNVIIDSMIADGSLVAGKETVSGMAQRYDEALNTWSGTWGDRNHVVVAINGSFHNVDSGLPYSGQIESGWYAKRFDDNGGTSGFAWTYDRDVFIGGCVRHPARGQIVWFHRTKSTMLIDGINVPRRKDQLILYTPQYDYYTHTGAGGVEVLVELTRPATILPSPSNLLGYVVGIRDHYGGTYLPFDHVVLSASGKQAERLLANVGIGDPIGLSMEVTHYQEDCRTPDRDSWTKTYASISGSFHFLQNGVIRHYDDDLGAVLRHPRTAICYNSRFVFFLVVDGRTEESVGMTSDELAVFCRDELGASDGLNQDGGGSSAMWVNGRIVNHPSGGEERAVANGMMMVVVEPMQRSTAFSLDQVVVAARPAQLRLGPGTNYAAVAEVPTGASGVIVKHRNGLEGVLATGEHWWRVLFDGGIGWVAQSSLRPAAPEEPPAAELPFH